MLSQACITAVSAASIVLNLHKRHPVYPATKTLIDYETLLTFTPPLLLGVSVGVLFNAAFPTWLITTMLITMLTFMSVRTTQKGLKQWGNETKRRQQEAAAAEAAAITAAVPQGPPAAAAADQQSLISSAAVVVISDTVEVTENNPKQAPYPAAMLFGVLFLWFGFSALQLLRQRTERCSPAYFVVCGSQVSRWQACNAFTLLGTACIWLWLELYIPALSGVSAGCWDLKLQHRLSSGHMQSSLQEAVR